MVVERPRLISSLCTERANNNWWKNRTTRPDNPSTVFSVLGGVGGLWTEGGRGERDRERLSTSSVGLVSDALHGQGGGGAVRVVVRTVDACC